MAEDLLGFRRGIIVSMLLYINLYLQIHYISAQNMMSYNCTNTIGNYTQDSLFQTNLNNLISSATDNAFNPFYSVTFGEGVDKVNGIDLCWKDVDDDSCRRCISNAVNNLTKLCPNQKEAIGWYDNCLFRYSNKSIYTTMSLTPFYVKKNSTAATNAYQFSQHLASLAGRLLEGLPSIMSSMSNEPTSKYVYVNGLITTPDGVTIYENMQCTPDINNDDCISCLNHTKNELLSCCDKVVGARYQTPSCFSRFEIYPFSFLAFLPSNPPPPPPPPPPQLSSSSIKPSNHPPPPPLSSSSTNTGMKPTIKNKKSDKSKTMIMVVCVTVALLVLALSVCIFITKRRWHNANTRHKHKDEEEELKNIRDTQTREYGFSLIRSATEDFSIANKLGRGGFGEVYKGVLPDGKEIAVKRLSTTSGQGESEFMNEVKSLAKLQHKCLVKLLGFCLEQTERLLIYEFMANGSLDKVLFDPVNRSRLDWERRYKIIKSIARGILYLHEDSRMMIIHRDLKTSNILLDEEMNAKISDFGMARLFVLDEGEVLTKRIAGTFGYMAPEYAMHGLFSAKSDVYSYGVLLLEIICGRKTYSSLTENRLEDLPAYAYKTWKEDKSSDLIDPMLTVDSDSLENMMRCIHIALLCVQENAGNRPTMAAVIHMLQSSTLTLPTPSGPGFFIGNTNTETVAPHATSRYDMLLNDDETDSYQYPR